MIGLKRGQSSVRTLHRGSDYQRKQSEAVVDHSKKRYGHKHRCNKHFYVLIIFDKKRVFNVFYFLNIFSSGDFFILDLLNLLQFY